MRCTALISLLALTVLVDPASSDELFETHRWPTGLQARSIAVSPTGEVYVDELLTNTPPERRTIRVYDRQGQFLREAPPLNSCGQGGYNIDQRLAIAPDGDLLVLEVNCGPGSGVTRVDPAGNVLWFTPLEIDGRWEDIAVDSSGNAWVPSAATSTVYKLGPTGAIIDSWDYNALGHPLNGVLVTPDGMLWFVTTGGNALLHKVDPVSHDLLESHFLPGGPNDNAEIRGMTATAEGNILITIHRFNQNPEVIEFDGIDWVPSLGQGGWDGFFPPTGINGHNDLWATPDGELFLANNFVIHRFSEASAPGPTATLDGTLNTALGGAQLQALGNGTIVLSGIGSSGQDGVEFAASAPDEGRGVAFDGGLPIDPAVDAGGSMVAYMTGTARGEVIPLGTLRADVVSDGIDLTADFAPTGATEVHVEAWLDDEIVKSCVVPNGTVIHRDSPGAAARRGGGNRLAAAGDGIEGVQVGLKKKPRAEDVLFKWITPQPITVGGSTVSANRISFRAIPTKQPTANLTARLKFARPVAPGASNLDRVFIAAEPAVADVGGAVAGGLRAEPRGGAVLAASADGSVLTGIGSSGQDGVEVKLDSSTGGEHEFDEGMGFDTSTDAGAYLEHRVAGKVGCVPDSTVAVLTETVYPDSITIAADFSRILATATRIEVFDEDVVVHDAIHPTGTKVRLVESLNAKVPGLRAASINTSRSHLKDKVQITSSRPSVSIRYRRPGASLLVQGGAPAMGFDVMIDASRYQGDEIRFTAVGGSAVPELTSGKILQKNPGVARLDTLRLKRPGVRVGDKDAVNKSVGAASLAATQGKLIIFDLGSSGNDGVKIAPERPEAAVKVRTSGVGDAASLPPGAAMRYRCAGIEAGVPVADVLPIGATKVGGAMRISPTGGGSLRGGGDQTLGLTSYRLEVLLGGAVVATVDGAAPEIDASRVPDEVLYRAAGPRFDGTWETPLSISVVSGPTVNGDEVRIRPLDGDGNLDAITEMDVLAKDLPSFEVGDWEIPVVGVVPPGGAGGVVSLSLGRNPVPAGDAIDFTVQLPGAARASVDLYDARGREVATLFRGVLPAGRADHRWVPGSRIGHGMYFVRLVTNGVTLSRKVVFID